MNNAFDDEVAAATAPSPRTAWLVALAGLAVLSLLSWQVAVVVGVVGVVLYLMLGSRGRAADRPALRWSARR